MAKLSGNYEVVFILNPNLDEEATAAMVAKFKTLVEQNGTLAEVEEWGKRHLAYPINDLTEGYYVLMTFSAKPEFPRELDRILRITDGVMRSLIVCKDEKKEGRGIAARLRVPLGVAEVHVVGDHLRGAALVAVPVGPVPELEPALHHCHTALSEETGDKFGGLTPGHDVDEVRGLLAGGLVLEVPVHRQGEGGHGCHGGQVQDPGGAERYPG